jgi:hypothetical protein
MSLITHALILASSTTTTYDPHKGAPLPAARVIVLAVPVVLLSLLYFRLKGSKK